MRGLPADVRAYVDRTKVPRINLAQDPRSGRSRLWIKFDTPMSKYAFALAVSAESVDGTTKVVDILRAQVHRVRSAGGARTDRENGRRPGGAAAEQTAC